MSRAVAEWVGRTDDTLAPDRVRLRVWEREHGRCHRCCRTIRPGERWVLEHRVAIINGGVNGEVNLCLSCPNCVPIKNAEDVAEKSEVATIRKKHILPKQPSRLRSRSSFRQSPGNVKQLEDL